MEKEQVYLWIGAGVIYLGIFVYFCNKNCAGNQEKTKENNEQISTGDIEMQDRSESKSNQEDEHDTTTEAQPETTNILNRFRCFFCCGTTPRIEHRSSPS